MIRALVTNGRIASLFIAIILVAGIGALDSLPRMEDPELTNRFATVVTPLPGATAERVEALVTEVLESELRRLEQLKLISSSSRPGISVIQLELKDEIMDPKPVWSRARDLLDDARPKLPTEAAQPNLDDEIAYAFTQIIGLSWQGDSERRLDMLNRYAKEIQSRLRQLPGTAFVKLVGEPKEEFLVSLDGSKLNQLQLSPAQIAQRLRQADAKVSAGELVNDNYRAQIEVSGELKSLERIAEVPLVMDPSGQLVRLGQVAEISRQAQWPPAETSLIDGEAGILIGVRMLPQYRVDRWSAQVKAQLAPLQAELPQNVKLEWLFEQEGYTQTRLSELMENLIQGFVLILLVLLLTLGWRNALIVAAALPLTALFTLAVMKYYGLPIHQMSVTGLVVALGIMVDNAIVIVDAIAARRRAGMDAIKAVKETVRHFWLPLAGSTITTILAFMPIVIMPGPAGEFVGGIALAVIFALIGSYAISHTLIAGLAGRFYRPEQGDSAWQHGLALKPLAAAYNKALSWAIAKPLAAVLLLSSVPVLGFFAAGKLPEQFFPTSDRDMFHIEVRLDPSSSIMATRRFVDQLHAELIAHPDIDRIDWTLGNNTPSFYYNLMQRQSGTPFYAQAMVKTPHFSKANRVIPELQKRLDEAYPEAQILVRKLEQGPPFNAPVELRIYGPDLDQLQDLGEQLRLVLSRVPQVTHTRATLSAATPKVKVNVDEEAALAAGLTASDVAQQLQMSTTGVVGANLLEQTESLDIRLKLNDANRAKTNRLESIELVSSQGKGIVLAAIADTQIIASRSVIPRRDGERVNVIEGYIQAGILPSVVLTQVQDRLAEQGFQVPSGYRVEIGGESQKRDEAVGKLLSHIGVIAVLLLTTVVLSFNSFRMTAIIMLSAFQSTGLGLLCVYAFGYAFGFNVIIALLGLMGLAINAAIVILAELKSMPSRSNQDVIEAVNSCGRHIGSTTITTVGGFTPLILAGGGFWPPFAVAIAGGTLLTSMLSLLWVPALYRLWFKDKTEAS
ncbi:efflux RND transporter permease subunit [Paraferrimonas sedimenticola]|uniref:Acriflavin resistance protein n=1 Tax=Paraferrimonas sedimenticola TaxID=375674 RepID=A0AA37W2Q4_9GAMM|nr:efflux RND transporter permease subunit [Paraferrimonas sedimenticola]GLP98112.1 acriflavin resistance protein [Paraferrimonas sedimenticola]